MTTWKPLSQAVLDAEAGVLGACIVQPTVMRDLPDLETDDFGHMPHKIVWQALRNLEAASRPIDPLTLEIEIERQGKLDAVGGVAYLGVLCLRVPTIGNVLEYATKVRDAHTARRVMVAAGAILQLGETGEASGEELLDAATTSIASIDGKKPQIEVGIGDLAARRLADVERFAQERAAGGRALSGAPTGIAELDAKIGGYQFGIVNLLAARPGMGKSSAALACADAASEAGIGVHVFSLEDSWHAYTDRQLARKSGVAAIKIRQAALSSSEISALYLAGHELKKRENWKVDDRGGLSAAELVRAMRRSQDKNGTRVAICDYLQLVRRRDPRMSENEHLGDVMQTLAESAKVDGVAWLALSQFNRELEKRNDKRPQLADLRGSGEIEEKCKIAVALYRGSYYGGQPKRDIDYSCKCPEAVRGCAHAPSLDQWEQQVQVLVLKGGNGPTGMVMASWDGPTTRIW